MTQRFTMKATEVRKSDNPNHWSHTLCEVFDNGVKVGEYNYNYSSGASAIFKPFEQEGQWYATYTDKYYQLKIMTLPDCKEFCTMKTNGDGFCPAECMVPEYFFASVKYSKDGKENVRTEEFDYPSLSEWIDKDDMVDFDFHDDSCYEKINKVYCNCMNNVYKAEGGVTTVDRTVRYLDKIIVSGCFWACPYEICFVDIADLKSKKGQTLEYTYICEERMYPFDEFVELKLRDRIHANSYGITVIGTLDVDYKPKIKDDPEPMPKTIKEKINATLKIWK